MEQINTKDNKPKQPLPYPKKPRRDLDTEKRQKTTRVICNLKQIILDTKSKRIRQYAVHFDPPISEDNYPLKKKLIRQLKTELTKNFKLYLQAGDTIFVCGDQCQETISLQTTNEDKTYKLTFTSTKNNINCRDITTKENNHIKAKHFIESLFKHIISSNNHIIFFKDRSFYDHHDIEIFGRDGKSKIMHGYSTALCITESGLFLRINDKNKMITGKTAYDKIMELSHKFKNNLNNEDYRAELENYFVGKTLVAQYGNYSAYRIGKIAFDRTPKNTSIEMKENDGKTSNITVQNYYNSHYKINLKNENQFLFIDEDSIKKKQENVRYLVPELLYLTGVDELDEKDRADIIAKSKFQPSEKVKKIEKGMRYLTNCEKKNQRKKNGQNIQLNSPEEIRQEWGITFGEKFVQVNARCLDMPEMEFKNSKPEKPQISHGRFRQKQDIIGVNFDSNNCTLITFEKIVSLAKNDCDQMCKACGNFGIQFKFPQLIKLTSHNNNDLKKELENLNFSNEKKMCIVVLDKSTKNLYPIIKDYLYSIGGISSQFMLHDENPNRGGKKKQNMSYYSAVLNQMVVKAQGELFRVPFCKGISSSPSMIIGIDSSRCDKGTKYVISASYNRFFNKFYTDFGIMKRDEKNNENNKLKEIIENCLNYFEKINNRKPGVIIIYRQGGNEKQTENVMRTEIPIIEKAIFNNNYKPKLTIFSVNKKTDLKFFENGNRGYQNIPMGTIIDRDVVSPDVFEFYLQCPDVDRGTASPVHFLCIYNNNENLTVNDFQDISYKQSFYYWNWPGPVRIPAALKYAEVANTFSGKNLKSDVLDSLKNSPYYI